LIIIFYIFSKHKDLTHSHIRNMTDSPFGGNIYIGAAVVGPTVFVVVCAGAAVAARVIARHRAALFSSLRDQNQQQVAMGELSPKRVQVMGCIMVLLAGLNFTTCAVLLVTKCLYMGIAMLVMRILYFAFTCHYLRRAVNDHELAGPRSSLWALWQNDRAFTLAMLYMLVIHTDAVTYLPWRYSGEAFMLGYPSTKLMKDAELSGVVMCLFMTCVSLFGAIAVQVRELNILLAIPPLVGAFVGLVAAASLAITMCMTPRVREHIDPTDSFHANRRGMDGFFPYFELRPPFARQGHQARHHFIAPAAVVEVVKQNDPQLGEIGKGDDAVRNAMLV
jgi:hypothetical protein